MKHARSVGTLVSSLDVVKHRGCRRQVITAHHRIHHRARVEIFDIDALRADDTGARRSSAS